MTLNAFLTQNSINIFGPLEQFQTLPLFFKINLNFSNFSLFYCLCAIILVYLAFSSVFKFTKLTTRAETMLRILSSFIKGIIIENVGTNIQGYSLITFLIFTFILFCNLVGLLPFASTVTSLGIYTFFWSFSLIIATSLISIQNQKFFIFNAFLPNGTPFSILFLIVIIELISYIARALSLAIRLAANLLAGHTLLKILVSLSWFLVIVGNSLSVFNLLIITLILIIFVLEFIIAFLQAYVFTVLFSIYLKNAIDAH